MRRPLTALVTASLTLLVATSARAEPASAPLEGWPCKGCVTSAPDGDGSPRPLLIALHGDDAGAGKLFRALRPACEQERVVLVSLRCPTDLGCRTSYWQWYGTSAHDPAWIGAQIAAVKGRFAIDPARVYAAGYSGGATYLGWYGPTHPSDFAAIVHIAGGMPWGTPCPRCKVPVLFTLGATDPMLVPYTRPLRDYYAACGGHEIVWEALPGVTHEGVISTVQAGKGKALLAWLLAHRAACGDAVADAGQGAAAMEPLDAAADHVDVAAPGDAAATPDPPRPSAPPAALKIDPRASSCACDLGAPAPGSGLAAWLALLALFATRRSRSL